MGPFVVVERQPGADPGPRLGHRGIGFDEHLLVLQTAPQPLDEDVVHEPALAIHADLDAVAFEHAGEVMAGELRTLVGIIRIPVSAKMW